jgi:hypothetical protein
MEAGVALHTLQAYECNYLHSADDDDGDDDCNNDVEELVDVFEFEFLDLCNYYYYNYYSLSSFSKNV